MTWPPGTVRAVLDTDFVTEPTRRALLARFAPVPAFDPVLDADCAALLAAVCDRLVPQPDRPAPIDIAALIHWKLAADAGNGWRYDAMPSDTIAMATGLRAIDATAMARFQQGFAELAPAQADAVLTAVQNGAVPAATWHPLDPTIFFEELLAGVAEAYYAHPLAQEEILYLGMADARGWPEIGFGARAAHEPAAP